MGKNLREHINAGDKITLTVREGDDTGLYMVLPVAYGDEKKNIAKCKTRHYTITQVYPHIILCRDNIGRQVTFDTGDLRMAGYL